MLLKLKFVLGLVLKRNRLWKTLRTWGLSWVVSFQIKLRGVIRNWGSIIHFTTGRDNGRYGYRIPAIWTIPGQRRIHFTSGISGHVNYIFNTKRGLPLNRWVSLKVTQRQVKGGRFRYTIYVNGRQVFTIINTKPRNFRNVKVYVSDPWYPAANGVIRRLIFKVIPVRKPAPGGMCLRLS